MWFYLGRDRKPIPRMSPFTTADQRTLLDKIGQIAGRGGKGAPGDPPVIPGAQPHLSLASLPSANALVAAKSARARSRSVQSIRWV